MSRSRRRAPRAESTESYVPRWPILAGALALVLVVGLGGYVAGLYAAEGDADSEEMTVVSGILVQPPGAPEEEPEPEEPEEEEETHPAGLDPELTYVLQNVHGDRVADVASGFDHNGAHIHLWDRHDEGHQQWRFVHVEDDFYEIVGVGSGKLLEIPADEEARPGSALLTRTGQHNQHWRVVELGEGHVRLLNRATGQALEGQGGGPDNGTLVAQGEDGGHAHQQWRLIPLDAEAAVEDDEPETEG
ncbi:RICIN domain-containing protein [Nocardiopsis valliformis]|uniref:RICIN domain-containing protein n=1 Tax=Nocardiopsis valliformis TaxID=239974 RepID=UPI000346877B|nr:RICIN domain-containing protein [Nocardiopsis valliformis]